ncbi:MAG TPA: serine hydrolase [Acidimicrobiia bacterium]|nr:serine hydrolase [Acidimicrobiia bacterium]
MDLPEQIESIRRDAGDGTYGVYARHLGTDEVVAFGADRIMPTASAAKQFILLTYARQVAEGQLDPATRVELAASDHVLGSGVLRYCTPGLAPTLDDIAYLMIIVSDNLATNVLLREVGGPDAVNALMDALSLPDARVRSPIVFGDAGDDDVLEFATSSTRDLAESFAVIGEPERAGYPVAAAEHCRRILRRQQHLDKLPRHLPWSPHPVDFGVELPVTVYSKTGSYPGVSTDAGLFVTADARWVAAVMASGLADWKAGPDGPAERACAEIGRALWRAWGPQR